LQAVSKSRSQAEKSKDTVLHLSLHPILNFFISDATFMYSMLNNTCYNKDCLSTNRI